jgi:hypothetical protein
MGYFTAETPPPESGGDTRTCTAKQTLAAFKASGRGNGSSVRIHAMDAWYNEDKHRDGERCRVVEAPLQGVAAERLDDVRTGRYAPYYQFAIKRVFNLTLYCRTADVI